MHGQDSHRRAQQLLALGALGCWLAAWVLPVMEGYPGWAAFRAALTGPFRENFPVRGEDAALQMLSAATNLVFVLLLLAWWRRRITRPVVFLKIALLCLLVNLYWLVEMLRAGEHHGLLVGYYAWLASFALLVALGAISAASARRTSKTPTDGTPA
jgi:hypothetical protein